jgi:hypothetical protein
LIKRVARIAYRQFRFSIKANKLPRNTWRITIREQITYSIFYSRDARRLKRDIQWFRIARAIHQAAHPYPFE